MLHSLQVHNTVLSLTIMKERDWWPCYHSLICTSLMPSPMSDKLNFTISQSAEIRKQINVGKIRDMTKNSYKIATTS